ncbi:M56 family metallopeptidase [Maribellus sediminis]|uniref:M56 family metallopeptidase n=1 Tax=Maribellus sediminis TaxID=2696285 RepID=UPI00143004AD|nr:M56 family metallopeptidase [Maribellus sediminis]
MIPYFIKFVLSSSILFLIYRLFLENEKMHQFNRFYLLFSILFSLIIPILPIIVITSEVAQSPVIFNGEYFQDTAISDVGQSTNNVNILRLILFILYILLTTYFFYRFLKNIFILWSKAKNTEAVLYKNAKVVLTSENHYPFSFLNYIFINRNDFKYNSIEEEIYQHELAHVSQLHSFDILFVELILTFAWLNPVLLLYKNAIQLNHEFLADDAVVSSTGRTKEYQYILINKSGTSSSFYLSSAFNFLPIKKRIIMMNKNVSLKAVRIKKMVLIPSVILVSMVFTFKIEARNSEIFVQVQQSLRNEEGVSKELLDEYKAIAEKHKKLLKNGKYSIYMNEFSTEEKSRMQYIFENMSREQKLEQELGFVPANTLYLKENVPSEDQFESFKDSKMYGVWIDNKRVDNEVLNKYRNTDFGQMSISKLMKNAKNYGKHYYQVDLMTTDYFRKYKDDVMDRKGASLVPIKMYEKSTQE